MYVTANSGYIKFIMATFLLYMSYHDHIMFSCSGITQQRWSDNWQVRDHSWRSCYTIYKQVEFLQRGPRFRVLLSHQLNAIHITTMKYSLTYLK